MISCCVHNSVVTRAGPATANSGEKRQALEIIAEMLQFLDRRPGGRRRLPFGEPEGQDAGSDELPF
jgi:hypothetical protein